MLVVPKVAGQLAALLWRPDGFQSVMLQEQLKRLDSLYLALRRRDERRCITVEVLDYRVAYAVALHDQLAGIGDGARVDTLLNNRVRDALYALVCDPLVRLVGNVEGVDNGRVLPTPYVNAGEVAAARLR